MKNSPKMKKALDAAYKEIMSWPEEKFHEELAKCTPESSAIYLPFATYQVTQPMKVREILENLRERLDCTNKFLFDKMDFRDILDYPIDALEAPYKEHKETLIRCYYVIDDLLNEYTPDQVKEIYKYRLPSTGASLKEAVFNKNDAKDLQIQSDLIVSIWRIGKY